MANKSKFEKVLWLVIECAIIATFLYLITGCSSKGTSTEIESTHVNTTEVVSETEINSTEVTRLIPTEEITTIVPTMEEPTEEATTVAEVEEKIYYTSAKVNIRKAPGLTGEVIATLNINSPLIVLEFVADGWSTVKYNDVVCFIFSKYLSETQYIAPEQTVVAEAEFHYYGIWSGEWWHFTPEQIDNQWAGYKLYKPVLDPGTTRAWQKYLYDSLCKKGLGWWYKYACAQAMQESGFNPLNNVSTDHGLFSFRIRYWNSAYGDVYDYHANINAYIDRIYPYLIGVTPEDTNGIDLALSQHYNPGHGIIPEYVNAVRGRLNELWICD